MTTAGTDDIARWIETDDPRLNEAFVATFLGWDGKGDPPPLFTSVEAVMKLLPPAARFIVHHGATGFFVQLFFISARERMPALGLHDKNEARAFLAALVRVKGSK